MNNFKKTALAIASVGVFSLGSAGTAQADALATSILQLQNLQFNQSGGGILTNGVDVTVAGFTQTANADATLNGATLTSGNVTGVGVDIPLQCVGDCSDPRLVENGFNIFSTALGDPSTQFAAADQLETGSPVAGIFPGPIPTPASVEAGAVTSLLGNATGDSNTNNTLNAAFVFTAMANFAVDIVFDATAYLEAFVTPGFFGESADASYSVSFTLVDNSNNNATIFDWSPNGLAGGIIGIGAVENSDPFSLNANRSSIDPFGGTSSLPVAPGPNVGFFSATTPVLTAGNNYTLGASMGVITNATSVPEPAMLALLGAGLLGIGAFRRRVSS